jgi:hypothetical protein
MKIEKSFCGRHGGHFCGLPIRGECSGFIHRYRHEIQGDLEHFAVLRQEVLFELSQESIPVTDAAVYQAAQEKGWSEITSYVVAML